MPETATKVMEALDRDRHAASRTADQICHLLREFIPEACFRDAWDRVAETCHKEGWELTNKMMRKEYEAWKSLVLDTKPFEPPTLPSS